MSTLHTSRLGVCVASNRPDACRLFIDSWSPFIRTTHDVTIEFFIHEDRPTKELVIDKSRGGMKVTHTCQADIDVTLGPEGWIIPRGSGASRSFPMHLAWRTGCDFILTMDDDCLPPDEKPDMFFQSHLSAFTLDRWFRTIGGEEPRGIPYGDKGCLPVLLNHGLWTGVPDFDAPTALVRGRWPQSYILRASREVIPQGMFFPLCAMNVCYHRSAIPAAYNLLMGLPEAGFDRFDDIWSGLFIKRIADHLGQYVTNGIPFVRHTKASNYFSNLRKEALGIQLHEALWHHVAAASLEGAHDVTSAYEMLAEWIAQFPTKYPELPYVKGYFEKLSSAMRIWAKLCS